MKAVAPGASPIKKNSFGSWVVDGTTQSQSLCSARPTLELDQEGDPKIWVGWLDTHGSQRK